ncbi:MAG: DUF3795 domain-containing protein [Myxococcales bacterium]|nr:MAG: DUF3795 domain-containing protein [Myxococcales bacterium]
MCAQFKTAYCGIDCELCPTFQATRNDDDAARTKTAEEWSRMFKAEIRPEHINCDGCKSETGRLFFHCTQCGIRACAGAKGHETCADCEDYGCDKLMGILDVVPEARATLEKLRAGKA